MRVALHSVLNDGVEGDYEREHQEIPPDLAATFARIGIRDWTIWRSGRDLFHLVECDDFDAAVRELADDPANLRWQAHIGRFIEHKPEPIAQVWTLS